MNNLDLIKILRASDPDLGLINAKHFVDNFTRGNSAPYDANTVVLMLKEYHKDITAKAEPAISKDFARLVVTMISPAISQESADTLIHNKAPKDGLLSEQNFLEIIEKALSNRGVNAVDHGTACGIVLTTTGVSDKMVPGMWRHAFGDEQFCSVEQLVQFVLGVSLGHYAPVPSGGWIETANNDKYFEFRSRFSEGIVLIFDRNSCQWKAVLDTEFCSDPYKAINAAKKMMM